MPTKTGAVLRVVIRTVPSTKRGTITSPADPVR
jgi:hypothetical protein